MKIKPLTFVIALAAVVGTAIGIAAAVGGDRSSQSARSDGDWPDYSNLNELIRDSDAVVLVRVEEERDVVTDESARGDPSVKSRTVERVRTLSIVDAYKGAFTKGSRITSVTTVSAEPGGDRKKLSYDIASVHVGETYVMFLRAVPRPAKLPSDLPETLYIRTGEPGQATLNGDELMFIAPRRFTESMEERGLHPAVAGSDAPFRATLEELRGSGR
jgi:hypothetical protein